MQITHPKSIIKVKMVESSISTKIGTGWGIVAFICAGGKPPYNLENKKEILQKHVDIRIKL